MSRHDRQGRDVTDLPGLWSEDDCEITATNYRHPSITTGQHTNGPAQVFIRLCREGYPWIATRMHSRKKVLDRWIEGNAFLPF